MPPNRPSLLITSVGAIDVLIGLAFIGFGVYALIAGADALASLFDLQRGVDQVVGNRPAADAGNVFSKWLSGIILVMVGIVAGCSIAQGLPALLVGRRGRMEKGPPDASPNTERRLGRALALWQHRVLCRQAN